MIAPRTPRRGRAIVTYAETYRAEAARIAGHCLPTLPSASAGFEVFEAHLLKAGKIERDGETFEFQDVRMYLRKSEAP